MDVDMNLLRKPLRLAPPYPHEATETIETSGHEWIESACKTVNERDRGRRMLMTVNQFISICTENGIEVKYEASY